LCPSVCSCVDTDSADILQANSVTI
jgi:hypothetical protein